jgi:hypothetical protein
MAGNTKGRQTTLRATAVPPVTVIIHVASDLLVMDIHIGFAFPDVLDVQPSSCKVVGSNLNP